MRRVAAALALLTGAPAEAAELFGGVGPSLERVLSHRGIGAA